MQIFSLIAASDPLLQSSETQAIFNVIVSGVALAQIVYMLPREAKDKWSLWLLLLASLVPCSANVRAIRHTQSLARQSFNDLLEHPVTTLINNAKTSLDTLLQRQFENYTAACTEYRHRYSVEPPDGFENRYNFATVNDFVKRNSLG
jgi:hypothetical protein